MLAGNAACGLKPDTTKRMRSRPTGRNSHELFKILGQPCSRLAQQVFEGSPVACQDARDHCRILDRFERQRLAARCPHLLQPCDSGSLLGLPIFLKKLLDPLQSVRTEDKTLAIESLHALNHHPNVQPGRGRR